MLVETAIRLHHAVRGGDTIARIGGDEFVIIGDPIRDPQEAIAVAERALAPLAAPFELPTGPVHCGASAGIAISEHHDTVEGLLSRADHALYEAKRAQRGSVTLARSTSPSHG